MMTFCLICVGSTFADALNFRGLTETPLEEDLGTLEDKRTPQTHCYACKTIPEAFLLCGWVIYPATPGRSITEYNFQGCV